ncbi:MAG: hypothetical protein ACI9JK_000038 [Phycisphaerales bacterium]|jgi:hypothetical protein
MSSQLIQTWCLCVELRVYPVRLVVKTAYLVTGVRIPYGKFLVVRLVARVECDYVAQKTPPIWTGWFFVFAAV